MTKILLKRGTQEKLDVATLSLGEPVFATDTKNFYIGDGVSKIKINGTTDHSALTKLDFASSGHTGFAPLDNPSFTTKISLTPSTVELLNFQTLSLKYQSTKGSIALNNNSAGIDTYSSVFLGTDSGTAITNSGYNNVAVGRYAMQNSASPVYSVAVGNGSLRNANGANNVAIGAYSSESNTSANNTVAIGYGSLRSNSSGNANIAIGSDALKNISTGIGNVGIGLGAGAVKKSGGLSSSNASSIYIGNDVKASDDTSPSNEIVIGSSAVSNGSNSITLGQNSSMPLYIGDKQIYDGSKITSSALPVKTFVSQIYGAGNNLSLQVNSDGTPVKGFVYSPSDTSAAFEVADPNALSLTLTNAAYQVPFYCPMSATIKSVILKSRYIISVPVVTNVININLYIYESNDGINYTKKTDTQTTLCAFSSSSVANIININKVENLNITLSQGKFYLVCLQPFRTSGSDASFNASAQCNLQVFYQYQ